jgi:hypothetical protein
MMHVGTVSHGFIVSMFEEIAPDVVEPDNVESIAAERTKVMVDGLLRPWLCPLLCWMYLMGPLQPTKFLDDVCFVVKRSIYLASNGCPHT